KSPTTPPPDTLSSSTEPSSEAALRREEMRAGLPAEASAKEGVRSRNSTLDPNSQSSNSESSSSLETEPAEIPSSVESAASVSAEVLFSHATATPEKPLQADPPIQNIAPS